MQSGHGGGVVLFDARTTAKAQDVAAYFEKEVAGRLYFVQEYEQASPIAECKRTARLPIRFAYHESFPPYVGMDCGEDDLCFELVHQFNLTVNACQISEI